MKNNTSVNHLRPWWKRFLGSILAWIFKGYVRTLKLEIDESTERICQNRRSSSLFLLWHNNIIAGYSLFRSSKKRLPFFALTSPSKDGAWLTFIFHRLGIQCIRGSSKRRGNEAIKEIDAILEKGALVGITPDGPRGPVYRFKHGPAMIAQETNCDVVLVAVEHSKCKRLKSWDKFKVPLPFSTLYLKCEVIRARDYQDMSVEEISQLFESHLFRLQRSLKYES